MNKNDICMCGDYRSEHDKNGCRVHSCRTDSLLPPCKEFRLSRIADTPEESK